MKAVVSHHYNQKVVPGQRVLENWVSKNPGGEGEGGGRGGDGGGGW